MNEGNRDLVVDVDSCVVGTKDDIDFFIGSEGYRVLSKSEEHCSIERYLEVEAAYTISECNIPRELESVKLSDFDRDLYCEVVRGGNGLNQTSYEYVNLPLGISFVKPNYNTRQIIFGSVYVLVLIVVVLFAIKKFLK